ncbi:hypothetical protein ES708_08031 [subsurface metagenome]
MSLQSALHSFQIYSHPALKEVIVPDLFLPGGLIGVGQDIGIGILRGVEHFIELTLVGLFISHTDHIDHGLANRIHFSLIHGCQHRRIFT